MDVNNGVVNYMRRITGVKAERVSSGSSSAAAAADPYTMCVLTVAGKAFLWHQIRCIVAVLFRVGEGKESPSVIDELLDVVKNPRRPQYVMASELPLNLFDCQFSCGGDGDDIDWNYDEESLAFVVRRFQVHAVSILLQIQAKIISSFVLSFKAPFITTSGVLRVIS